MAALRLGFLTAYLSPPLTSGYTTASALYIATSQLPSLFGVPSVRYEGPLALFYSWAVRFLLIACTTRRAAVHLRPARLDKRVRAADRPLLCVESMLTMALMPDSHGVSVFCALYQRRRRDSLSSERPAACQCRCTVTLLTGLLRFAHSDKRLKFPIPAELMVVVATTLAAYFGDFASKYGISEAGVVPSGMAVAVTAID